MPSQGFPPSIRAARKRPLLPPSSPLLPVRTPIVQGICQSCPEFGLPVWSSSERCWRCCYGNRAAEVQEVRLGRLWNGGPLCWTLQHPLMTCREAVRERACLPLSSRFFVSASKQHITLSVDFCALLIMQTPLVSLSKWYIKTLAMRRMAFMWSDSWFSKLWSRVDCLWFLRY